MAEERTEKSRALDLAVSQIEKQFGKGSIMRLGGIDSSAALDAIPSGSLSLGRELGRSRSLLLFSRPASRLSGSEMLISIPREASIT